MGSDKKKRSRSRRKDDDKKRKKSRSKDKSGSRKRSASPSKKRKEESSKKKAKRKSSSRHRSDSRKDSEAKRKSSSRRRSRSGRRRSSSKKRGGSSKKRRSPSGKRGKSKDRGRDKKGRSRSRRKSRSKSDSEDSSTPVRRKPRNSGFDQREPVPEAQLSEALSAAQFTKVQMALPVMGPPPREPNPEVEAFLATNLVEPHAANQLRGLPLHLQRVVLARGSLQSARDKSAVLTSRISDALTGGSSMRAGASMGAPTPAPLLPPPSNAHPGIEALIARYNLDARCSAMLRGLPPDKQATAAQLPVHEARNPSAFVMAQIQLLFGWRSGLAPTPAPPQGALGAPPPPPPGMPGMPGAPPPPPPALQAGPIG